MILVLDQQLPRYLAYHLMLSETSFAYTQPSAVTLIFEHFAIGLIDSNQQLDYR